LHLLLKRKYLVPVGEDGHVGAKGGRESLTRLFHIKARQHRDSDPRPGNLVDRLLQMAIPTALALDPQGTVARLQVVGEGCDAPLEVGPVGLTDQQVGFDGAVDWHFSAAIGHLGRALFMGEDRSRRYDKQGQTDWDQDQSSNMAYHA